MEKEPAVERHDGVKINLSAALGEAGHEVEELGFENTPDTGPVVTNESEEDEARDPDVFVAGFPVPIDGREPRSDDSGDDA